MAIAIDVTSSGNTSGATSLTISHTVSGLNRVLVVGTSTQRTISSVTYNGVALTQGVAGTNTYFYYLVNPDTGTHNIVITVSLSGWIMGYGASLTGCDTGNPIDTTTTASISPGNAITANLVTTKNNSFVFDNVTEYSSSMSPTVGTGQTQIANTVDGTSNRTRLGSYEQKVTLGSTTMSWDGGTSAGGADISLLSIAEISTFTPKMIII